MTTPHEHPNLTVAPKVSPVERPQAMAPGRTLRKRRSPWPTRLAVVVVLGGAVALVVRGTKKPPLVVETTRVERGAVRDEISSSSAGEVMAEQVVTVRSELMGRALAVRHKRGERVKKGEVIVTIDPADLAARLRQAEATLEAQRAQLGQLKSRAETAARTAERTKRLAEHGAETSQLADDSSAQAREADAAAKAGQAQVDQSQAAVEVARVARSHAELVAPFGGLLAEVAVNAGDAIQLGATAFELVDDSQLHVEATIDEADIGRVRLGQPAALRLDALPDRTIEGRVSKLDPTVRKDAKGARTLRIEVALSDLGKAVEAGVRPGMSANVDVRVAEKADVLSLPTSVIIGRGTKRSVYVVDQGVLREKVVQIGMSSWDRTEIASGVREGDLVVTTLNVKGLADGVLVQAGAGATAP